MSAKNTQLNSFKGLAKDAKRRMKTGYWRDFDEDIKKKVEAAYQDGGNPSKAKEYYVNKTLSEMNGKLKDDEFYRKVCKLINEYGEAGDAIGRLIDHSVFDNLSYDRKQRYILELSNKYLDALDRYRKEKEFGGVSAETH
ncbi:MAG: hypothetical protein IJR61_01690 [Clostridia bacterium]|nr:hypothetical protein [Clostridia bacterium]